MARGGDVLAGRYELVELLGRGGMGQVWSARDRVIGRPVAVKVLYDHGDGEAAGMFLREARAAGSLVHPAVVTVHDLGNAEDGTLFLVMERLTGRDLASVVRDDGPVPVASALAWVDEICSALTVAHRDGLIHRDIKPANLFLTKDHRIKVLDFGIARYVEAVSASASRVIGTIAYMPPERIHGRVGDHRGDLYSLGCVLHELLVGQPPFGDTGSVVTLALAHAAQEPVPLRRLRADVPPWLERLTLDLLAKDPDDRPADAAAVRGRLVAPPVPVAAGGERPPAMSGAPLMRVTHPGGSIEISVTAPLPVPAPAANGHAPPRPPVSGQAIARGLRARRILGHRGPVTSLAFSADGTRLASAGTDVRIWDAYSAESVAEPVLENTHTLLSANRGALLVGLSGNRLVAWEGVGATPVQSLTIREMEVHAAAASTVGPHVVVAGTRGRVVIVDTHTWATRELPTHVRRNHVRALACAPRTGLVAAGYTNGVVGLWNIAAADGDGRPVGGHTGWVRALAFSPDGRLLASAGDDGLIRIRDVMDDRAVGEPLSGHTGWIHDLAFSPDGLLLASCGQDRTLRFWDPLDGSPIGSARTTPTERRGHPPAILAVAFSADGGRVATGDADHGVTLWSAAP